MFFLSVLLYNILFPILFILYIPFMIVKLYRRGGFDIRFMERFGFFTAEQKKRLRSFSSKPIWVHAVSVGETVAAITFIKEWRQKRPDLNFVLSTGTTTGQEIARKKAPEGVVVVYYPLDWYPFVAIALRHINPALFVIFEVEIWPNLILQSSRVCPVAIANGRMSEKSAVGYRKHAWFFKPLMKCLSAICVQEEEDAAGFREVVGEANIHVCSTMKFDQVPDLQTKDMKSELNKFFGPYAHRFWVAGSTHAGEEKIVLEAYKNLRMRLHDLKLILVPRHAERAPEIEKLLKQMELSYRLFKEHEQSMDMVDVLLVNTTGELMNFYAIADVVYVGKSLAGNWGGHNIIEPAIFGKPIVHGDNMQNFKKVVDIFQEAHACIEVIDGYNLEIATLEILADKEFSTLLSERSRKVVQEHRGAISKNIDVLEKCLEQK